MGISKENNDLIYAGYNFSDEFYVEQIRRPWMQPILNESVQANDRNAYHRKTRRAGHYTIETDVRLIEDHRLTVTELKRRLSPLLFKTRPHRLETRQDPLWDMAILDGQIDFARFLATGFATLFWRAYGPSYGAFRTITGTSILNQGTDETWPVITLTATGSASSITVQSLTTGETMHITQELSAGQSIVIGAYDAEYRHHQTMTMNGSIIMDKLSSQADFIRLLPGENTLQVTGATVKTEFWERWL